MTTTDRMAIISEITAKQDHIRNELKDADDEAENAYMEGQIDGLTAARNIIDSYCDEQKRDERS